MMLRTVATHTASSHSSRATTDAWRPTAERRRRRTPSPTPSPSSAGRKRATPTSRSDWRCATGSGSASSRANSARRRTCANGTGCCAWIARLSDFGAACRRSRTRRRWHGSRRSDWPSPTSASCWPSCEESRPTMCDSGHRRRIAGNEATSAIINVTAAWRVTSQLARARE